MITFQTINLEKYRSEVIRFRKDSFKVSFGDASHFGDENEYIKWLKEKIILFPEGFVLVKENHQVIGQLELSIREYNDTNIGYIHLYYLIPEKRGKHIGKELHNYAMTFFQKQNVLEYHLRVSPQNKQAIKFYLKNGMQEVGIELKGKVIRMKGFV